MHLDPGCFTVSTEKWIGLAMQHTMKWNFAIGTFSSAVSGFYGKDCIILLRACGTVANHIPTALIGIGT